ncbi:lysylphosphatidylglycerol synthase transmembrane domain-containing protein [Brachyspira hyodysenteriae]|uniref:lysylphosphatidylglycerol synthase transmembrane domain-containing protein n=1 Tax=Brachyspira hyodysenteriae TaxID=159 RepID=UPI002B26423B|nr:lysylphosphatidylglycerol synthase transmembrane domain-containing protein [Brachyspira hyodysenteriae]WPC38878.1 lysylphosphatidylglycerol synthase transmembrane domain-containing protein [Brachyspira hyodysenteriae]
MNKNHKTIIQVIIGIAVSIICLYFAFRGINIKESIEIVKNINVKYFLISLVLSILIIALRGLRWECFIPLKKPIKKRTVVMATYIGYMGNNILPAKLGEVARAYILGMKENVSKSALIASVVTERLFDVITGGIILTISVVFIPDLPQTVTYAAIALFVLSIIGFLVLMFLVWQREFAHKVFHKIFGILPKNIGDKLIEFSCNFIDGIGFKNDPKHIFLIFFYTVLYLIGQVCTIELLMTSFNIKATPIIALFMFAIGGFGFAVPSAPSGIGPFEWAIIFGLSLIGVEKSIAAPYALVYHIMGIVPIVIIGFVFLFMLGIDLKTATKGDNQIEGKEENDNAKIS